MDRLQHRLRILTISTKLAITLALLAGLNVYAQDKTAPAIDVTQKLAGFDAFMEKTLKDWNAPGIGVGIVIGDKLVFAKGYGYRDYEKKLPITANTLYPIASNTKLFTAVAAGFLVEEGKLTWDRPIRESVPTIEFHDSFLNNTVTLVTNLLVALLPLFITVGVFGVVIGLFMGKKGIFGRLGG